LAVIDTSGFDLDDSASVEAMGEEAAWELWDSVNGKSVENRHSTFRGLRQVEPFLTQDQIRSLGEGCRIFVRSKDNGKMWRCDYIAGCAKSVNAMTVVPLDVDSYQVSVSESDFMSECNSCSRFLVNKDCTYGVRFVDVRGYCGNPRAHKYGEPVTSCDGCGSWVAARGRERLVWE
jgi:hypothetical protein